MTKFGHKFNERFWSRVGEMYVRENETAKLGKDPMILSLVSEYVLFKRTSVLRGLK